MKQTKLFIAGLIVICVMAFLGCSTEAEKHIELNFYGNNGLYEGLSTYYDSPAETIIINYHNSFSFSKISKRFTRTGYVLLGWSKSSFATTATYSATGSEYFSASDGPSLNLYAVWKSDTKEINLNFYANGGNYEGSYVLSNIAASTATVDEGVMYSMASTSSKFTYDGYTLLGWSRTKVTPSVNVTTLDCDVLANGSTAFSSTNGTTISLYAVWQKIASVTVRFYGNGGLFDGSSTNTYTPAFTSIAEIGKAYSISSTSNRFTYSGYTLLGWSKTKQTPSSSLTDWDCDVTASESITFSGNDGDVVSLYAVWKKIATVTVKFYGNGGLFDGSSTSTYTPAFTSIAEIGKAYSISSTSNRFTYSGYTLLGWSRTKMTPSSNLTDWDCDVTASGSTSFSGNDGDEIILYAVWKAN